MFEMNESFLEKMIEQYKMNPSNDSVLSTLHAFNFEAIEAPDKRAYVHERIKTENRSKFKFLFSN